MPDQIDYEMLSPQRLLHAYSLGVFPMADETTGEGIYWVSPRDRGIFPLDGLHISRSLAKAVRSERYRVEIDADFIAVIDGCAATTSERESTWINKNIRRAFIEMHALGFAHCINIYDGYRLVGGLYGLAIGGAFFGESMFHTASDASKIALVHLTAILRLGGYALLDTQFITDHLASLGAVQIPQKNYMKCLQQALQLSCRFGHCAAGNPLPNLSGEQALVGAKTGTLTHSAPDQRFIQR